MEFLSKAKSVVMLDRTEKGSVDLRSVRNWVKFAVIFYLAVPPGPPGTSLLWYSGCGVVGAAAYLGADAEFPEGTLRALAVIEEVSSEVDGVLGGVKV